MAIFITGLGIVLSILQFDWYEDAAPISFAALGVLLFPFWDATLLSLSGGSPGRAIFRFRVSKKANGQHLGFGQAVTRAWGASFFGCGLGIPLVGLVTMLLSKSHLEKHGASGWDTRANAIVVHEGPRWWSWLLLSLTLFGFVALYLAGTDSGY